MFILKCIVKIGDYSFTAVHDIEINKSVETISDTALIKLPRKFIIRKNGITEYTDKVIKINDPVTVTLGYEGHYEGVEFRGFVSKIGIKTPLEIHCEDFIYLLRKKSINRNFGKTTLKEILTEVVKDIEPPLKLAENIPNIPFEKYLIKNKNGAQVLQELNSNYLISSFIDDQNNLYSGLMELTNIGEKVLYNLNSNIVSNDLDKIEKSNTSYLVKYTYIDPSNKRTTVEVGDKNGEVKDYHTSILSDMPTLKLLAEKALKELKNVGFSGSITSFLIPFANRGMAATIIDTEHPELQGNYFIKTVDINFGLGGARRKISLGNKL